MQRAAFTGAIVTNDDHNQLESGEIWKTQQKGVRLLYGWHW